MKEEEKDVQIQNLLASADQSEGQEAGMTRKDLLKMLGVGGLGMAAMLGGVSSPAIAQGGKRQKFFIVITGGSNDPNRAMLALLLADVIQKQDFGDVHLYLVLEGAELCKVGRPEKIFSSNFHRLGNAFGVLERLVKNGARIGVCPPCADWIGAVDKDKYDWATREDGIVMLRAIMESITLWL